MERIIKLQELIKRRENRNKIEGAIPTKTPLQGSFAMSPPGSFNEAVSNVWNSSKSHVPDSNPSSPSAFPQPAIISCQLCPAEIVLPAPDQSVSMEDSHLLKNLGFQLSLNRQEMPLFFANEMSYFCNDCKNDLELMWELHKQTLALALKLQKKVVAGRQEGVVRKPLESCTVDAAKFIKLRDLITQDYFKKNKKQETPWVSARMHLATPQGAAAAPISLPVIIPQRPVVRPVIPQQSVAPMVNFGNASRRLTLRSSTSSQPKPTTVKKEQVSADVEAVSDDDDDGDQESIFVVVERPEGSKRDLCNGVEILECVTRNQMKFYHCSVCPFRLFFTDDMKMEMRHKMGTHIKSCHKKKPRAANASPRRGPLPRNYCCKICDKTFAYRKWYRAHRRTHPEFLNGSLPIPDPFQEASMPILTPQVAIPDVHLHSTAQEQPEMGELFNSNGMDEMPAELDGGGGGGQPSILAVVVKHEYENE